MAFDELDALLNYGCDIKRRTIILGGEVSPGMFLRCDLGLRTLLAADQTTQINVLLNSYGGDLCQGLAIYEVLKRSPAPVLIHAIGACMSAGSLILQAGTKRVASPDCSIMLHFGEETNESGSEHKHNLQLGKRMKEIYRERAGRSAKMVNKWLEKDTYFTAAEALKAKLIDEVV